LFINSITNYSTSFTVWYILSKIRSYHSSCGEMMTIDKAGTAVKPTFTRVGKMGRSTSI